MPYTLVVSGGAKRWAQKVGTLAVLLGGCTLASHEESRSSAPTVTLRANLDLEAFDGTALAFVEANHQAVTVFEIEESPIDVSLHRGIYSAALLDQNGVPVALLAHEGSTFFELDRDVNVGTLRWNEESHELGTDAPFRWLATHRSYDGEALSARANATRTEFFGPTRDSDSDGIPEVLDFDANGDGVSDALSDAQHCFNRVDVGESLEELRLLRLVGCRVVDATYDTEEGTRHVLRLDLTLPARLASRIASARVAYLPGFARGSYGEPDAGFHFPDGYPAGALGATDNELACGTSADGTFHCVAWVEPFSRPKPALFQFAVETKLGARAFLTTRMQAPFESVNIDRAEIETNVLSDWTASSESTEGVAFLIARPLLEDGMPACGLEYTVELETLGPSSAPVSGSKRTVEIRDSHCDSPLRIVFPSYAADSLGTPKLRVSARSRRGDSISKTVLLRPAVAN